jgi:pSer/pThr/pTyr-binding forkhead associated (FHA) protein
MDKQIGQHTFRVSLIVMETDEVINLDRPGDFIIGRLSQNPNKEDSDDRQAEDTEIDLSSYQAYETGVSRRHAALTIRSENVTLTDLGSTNGTRINGNMIPALSPQELHNEDIITLGKLKVQILMMPV